MTSRPPLALVGPTASGKTDAAVAIAERLHAEVVNIDSTLVFRGMDVWTGKPTSEQRRRVPHHLMDLVDPIEPFSVAEFQSLARRAIQDIRARGRGVLLVGGSGLYYRAVVDGLEFPRTEAPVRRLMEVEASLIGPEAMYRRLASFDPEAASRIQPANARRTVRALEVAAITGRPFSAFARAWDRFDPAAVAAAGLDVPREILHRRIEERARRNFPGLMAETRGLLEAGFGRFIGSYHVIGYAEAAACLEGRLMEEEAVARVVRRDKALARRQMAWFRRDPRIRWFSVGEEGATAVADEVIGYFEGGSARRVQGPRSVRV